MTLSRREYSPKTIRLWDKAGKRLASLEKGSLAVQTDPAVATVMLDGVQVGKTPFIGSFPHGQYHLQVIHEKTGGAVRWVRIGPKPARIRLQLSFEGALLLSSSHPCVRLPEGSDRLPEQWWPWLGDRLGLQLLVAVRKYSEGERPYLSAALVDLERGHRVREASLELAKDGPEKLKEHARALADFLVTGKAIPALQVRKLESSTKPDPIGTRVPDLPVHYAPRPWHRKWWPWALASGVLAGGALGAHLASDHYQRKADQAASVANRDEAQKSADSWMAVAVTGYAAAGAAIVTGLILHLTFQPEEVFESSAIAPAVGPDSAGLIWTGRF